MKKTIFLLVVVIAFLSCNNSKEQGHEGGDKKDSAIAPVPIADKELAKTYTHFKKTLSLPFIVDTALINKIQTFDSLGTNEIKPLDKNWLCGDGVERFSHNTEDFYRIDSLKATGKYSDWCDSLTPGMPKYARAYAIGKIEPEPNTIVLVWSIFQASYEACPYWSGTRVYFTIIRDGRFSQSFFLGESSGGGDAPVTGETAITGKLNADGTFTLDVRQTLDEDPDRPTIEVTNEHYSFAIQNGKVFLKKEVKEKPFKEKRAKRS